MYFLTISRCLLHVVVLITLVNSVYPVRPSVLLKRSLLRHRLLAMPATLRPKRQLFREDIPHHRPLTGNTYYLHAGFPHPSRWHEGAQVIPPDPNPITHHHLHHKPGLHDDPHDHNNHDHHNHVNHEFQNQLVHPPHKDDHHHHHNGYGHGGNPGPFSVNNKNPHTVNIHSSIVHGSVGGVIDNSLGNLVPHAPVSPHDQANFDPLLAPYNVGPRKPPVHVSKPHSEPEPYDDDYGIGGGGDYDHSIKDISPLGDPGSPLLNPDTPPVIHQKEPQRKPKTIIHYHPVTVGNIINFNDDNKPVLVTPSPVGYGPPEHVPGIPLTQKDLNSVMLSMSEPFINSPFKTVNGPPGFLDFGKEESVQYGPPQHVPGVPLGSVDLGPMLPSYGPPLKSEAPPYGIALPVIAHLHNPPPPPPPFHRPKHHRGKGRAKNHHHLHLHHIHHPPPPPVHAPVDGPFYGVKHPNYVVRGHVPSKLVSYHSPNFRSHSHSHTTHHHHHKSFWSW